MIIVMKPEASASDVDHVLERIAAKGLKPLHMKARMLVMQIGNVKFEHVPRELNKDADRLSNVGMDGNGELR